MSNVTLNPNNYQRRHNPSFTSIKSIKCEGLYKKYPGLANELVTSFQKNPKAMEFCKKYDVDIVFHAIKQMQDSVESSINIFFDNLSKSKARKFFDKLTGNSDDKIVIHAWGNKYSLSQSIEESTKDLKNKILPEKKVGDSFVGGLLDSHIEMAEEKIQNVLNRKSKNVLEKEMQSTMSKSAKEQLDTDASKLQSSINKLIEEGN